jgi:hypothetical protein
MDIIKTDVPSKEKKLVAIYLVKALVKDGDDAKLLYEMLQKEIANSIVTWVGGPYKG